MERSYYPGVYIDSLLLQSSSAERPAHSAADDNKPQTSVEYISFFPKDFKASRSDRSKVIQALRSSKDANIDIINMAFATAADIDIMWSDLDKEISRKSSAAQPAFWYRANGNLLTIFFENCGKLVSETNIVESLCASSICLMFDGPAGRMSSINVHCAGLPSITKQRLFAQYLRESLLPDNSLHIIGGQLGDSSFFERHVRSRHLGYEIYANGVTCAAAQTSDDISECHCFPVEYDIANAIMIQVWQKWALAPDSDAHPGIFIPRAKQEALDSDAHPVRTKSEETFCRDPDNDAHPSRWTLPACTPLWDKLVEHLDAATSSWQGRQFMQFIQEQCFFGDMCVKKPNGDNLESPVPFSIKMEWLLETAAERRRLLLNRLRRSAAQPVVDAIHEIEENDMRSM